MGCPASKNTQLRAQLKKAHDAAQEAPWIEPRFQASELPKLHSLISELKEITETSTNSNLKEGSPESKRLRDIGFKLANDITKMLDVKLLDHRDSSALVQKLLAMAETLESVGVENARVDADAKHKESRRKHSLDRLEAVEERLQNVAGPEPLRRVLATLEEINTYLADVPDLVGKFLESCRKLALKIEDVLGQVSTDVRQLLVIWELSRTLDGMCSELDSWEGQPNWELVLPKVQKVGKAAADKMLPGNLERLEAEAKKDDINREDLIKCLENVAALWIAPSLRDQGRLRNCLFSLERRILEQFKSKPGYEQEELIRLAGRFDHQCTLMQSSLESNNNKGSSCQTRGPLKQTLERKKAKKVLKKMLTDTDERVSEATKLFLQMHADVSTGVRTHTREALWKRAERTKWSFQRGKGNYKLFDVDKSDDVEKAYLKYVQGGRPPELATKEIDLRRGRERCKYAERGGCTQKNELHKAKFCHPGDDDWDGPPKVPAGEEGLHTYILDFTMPMMQRHTATGARRLIKREEGMTLAKKLTHEYYEKQLEFLKGLENDFFGDAEAQLRILGEEGISIQRQVDKILQAIEAPLRNLLQLAVYCGDKYSLEVIEKVEALLGERGERLGVKASLKSSYMENFIEDLGKAYLKEEVEGTPKKWALLQRLCKRQPVPPRFLLKSRLAVAKAKRDHDTTTREHLHMRCQGLFNTYADDEEFASELRRKAVEVLTEAAQRAASKQQLQEVLSILRTAASWECSVGDILETAGMLIAAMIQSTCKLKWEPEPVARLNEILQTGHAIAQVSGDTGHTTVEANGNAVQTADQGSKDAPRTLQSLGIITPELVKQMASRALSHVVVRVEKDLDPGALSTSVTEVVDLRGKLRPDTLIFDHEFWCLFEPQYKAAKSTRITEWAIAYCEQLKVALPMWMMNKDQVEAHNKLQAAVNSNEAQRIREAVVFAKQANCSTNENLMALFEQATNMLKQLNRLPAGWDVPEMVGVDPKSKMFRQADMNNEEIKRLFQQVLSETRRDVVTRDRFGGAVPSNFKVEQITSVMNEESWQSYMARLDKVCEECKRFAGPCTDETWKKMGGPVEGHSIAQEIMRSTNLPELNPAGNEFLLFHGTNPKAAESIAKKNFDMAFSCKTGLFGAGVYFSESSTKADEYAKPAGDDLYPMIICRVCLGHVNYCDDHDPTKSGGRDKLPASCTRGEHHSVLGDRKKVRGTYREFVVYDAHQTYPHFIVWYRRLW